MNNIAKFFVLFFDQSAAEQGQDPTGDSFVTTDLSKAIASFDKKNFVGVFFEDSEGLEYSKDELEYMQANYFH
jgi:hypothetical protein